MPSKPVEPNPKEVKEDNVLVEEEEEEDEEEEEVQPANPTAQAAKPVQVF